MATLNVNIGRLQLKNPVMTASGTFGYGLEFQDFVPLDGLGAIIVKGTTLHSREGNDYPRMAETPSGMLNCVGLQNKGVSYFCEKIYPQLLVNVRVTSKNDAMEDAEVRKAIEEVNAELAGNGRLLVRPSGTEPLIRVMAEAETDEICAEEVGKVADVVRRKFGA